MGKFITLTSNDKKEGCPKITLNTDHIVSIMHLKSGFTSVKLSTQQHFYVEETKEQIINLINN